jgi:hypothetical protein
VGNNSNGAKQTLLAADWNGTAWHAATMPSPKGRTPTISGVVDLSPSDGWAVGYATGGSTNDERRLIEHWNGSTWTIVPSPNPMGGTAANDALEPAGGVSATDVWAVGQKFSFDGGGITLLFEHFNGTAWEIVPTPDPAQQGTLISDSLLAAASPGAGVVWAVGGKETLGECCQQTLGMQTTGG